MFYRLNEFSNQMIGIFNEIFPRPDTRPNLNGEYILALLNPSVLKSISPDLRAKYRQGFRNTVIESLRRYADEYLMNVPIR